VRVQVKLLDPLQRMPYLSTFVIGVLWRGAVSQLKDLTCIGNDTICVVFVVTDVAYQ